MFDIFSFNFSESFVENVHLSCILLFLVLGMLILILFLSTFLKYDHTNSHSLFLVLLIGFIHQSFVSMNWLKSTYHLDGITEFVFDWYTFPVACFILTFGVVCMTEISKEEFRTKIFQNGVFISTVLLLVFGIGVYGFNNQDANYSQVKFNKSELGNMITIVSYALEYVLVFAPLTVILLWNMKGCVLIKDQKGLHHEQCMTCDNNIMVQRYVLIFMMFVIWIVRPCFWIIDFHFSVITQDFIPSMTVCMVYIYLLWDFGIYQLRDFLCRMS